MNKQAVTYQQVAILAERLPPVDKARLIRQLMVTLERETIADLPEAPGWPPGFIERTYGSLASDPLERPAQDEPDKRDTIP